MICACNAGTETERQRDRDRETETEERTQRDAGRDTQADNICTELALAEPETAQQLDESVFRFVEFFTV
eukprot:COSAG03_NODE_16181_length_409_cov_1.393548_1_plen_68_part_01